LRIAFLRAAGRKNRFSLTGRCTAHAGRAQAHPPLAKFVSPAMSLMRLNAAFCGVAPVAPLRQHAPTVGEDGAAFIKPWQG